MKKFPRKLISYFLNLVFNFSDIYYQFQRNRLCILGIRVINVVSFGDIGYRFQKPGVQIFICDFNLLFHFVLKQSISSKMSFPYSSGSKINSKYMGMKKATTKKHGAM